MYRTTRGIQPMFCNNCKWKVTFKNCIKIKNFKNKNILKNQKSIWTLLGDEWSISWQWPGCGQGFPVIVRDHFLLSPAWSHVCPSCHLINLFCLTATCVNNHYTEALNKCLFNEYSGKQINLQPAVQKSTDNKISYLEMTGPWNSIGWLNLLFRGLPWWRSG